MILGVGTDLCNIERIEATLARFGDRFRNRVFTEREQAKAESRPHGIAATYVGHPLAQVIPLEPDRVNARLKLGLRQDAPVLALLPGSRQSEVAHLAVRFFQAAAIVQQAQPTMQFLVPAVPALMPSIEQAARASGMGADRHVIVLHTKEGFHWITAECHCSRDCRFWRAHARPAVASMIAARTASIERPSRV
jgi:hypothetical protein